MRRRHSKFSSNALRCMVSAGCALALPFLALFPWSAAAQSVDTVSSDWHGEVGAGVQSFAGERFGVLEMGALRHESGNRSLALGGQFLLAPEPMACVGLGPCPDGPWRVAAVGAHVERRFQAEYLPASSLGEIRVPPFHCP